MSVPHACLRVLTASNNFYPCPLKNDAQRIIQNPLFASLRAKWILNTSDFTCAFLICCSGCRLVWLYNHWDDYTLGHLSEAVVNFVVFCSVIIGMCTTPMFRFSPDAFRWLLNQKCFQVKEALPKDPLPAYLLQIAAAGFFIFPTAGFVGPFIIDYSPLQVYFGTQLGIKLITSAVYGLAFLALTAKILTCFSLYILSNYFVHVSNERLLSMSESFMDQSQSQFDACNRLYSIGVLSLRALDDIVAVFQSILIFFGVMLGSTALFAVIDLYNELHILIYSAMCLLAALTMLIAVGNTKLLGLAYEQGQKFRNIWKMKAKPKYTRQIVKSWQHMGINIQPYGLVKPVLGLNICDDIVNNTVTLLCIKM